MTGHRYRLFFPLIALATSDGERIESVEVTVSCGRFRALTDIPNDWSAEVVSPMSEQTTLRASAGHGSSTLWSIRDLDGAITVSVEETSCFDITAKIGTTASEHRFTRSDLILKP
jgi:antirestriction protein